ncbi:MAG TPA: hypothetical protein VJ372_07910 [Pyrinomonadaceae bacterium]|jgi:Predicted solute binding protein|nr:hypothetical protein [Pyrinomonadaceae bacterium]
MYKNLVISLVLAISVGLVLVFNSSRTVSAKQDPAAQASKPQTKKQTNRAKGGSAKKPTAAAAESTGDQSSVTTDQTASTPTTSKQVAAPSTQTDLSGTYTGVFKCDEIGLTGDSTLTINGNQFTTGDGKTGRIVASTTRGYTAVALQMGDATTATPTVVSLRGRKSGDRLTLTSVDSAHPCSFTPGRATSSRRTRKSESAAPAAVGAEVASPAEAGPAPADVIAPATPKGRKTRKGTSKSTPGASTTTMPTPNPTTPTTPPTETPATVPAPTQSPMPMPSPSPSGSPTASPTPAATPSPSPSPSPSPAPKRP